MANHVYFNIELDCNLSEAVTMQTIERKMWNSDDTYEVQELVEAHEFPMYAHLEYKDDNWYDWYCENVGAKWINFDDFDLDAGYISGYSAWCAPVAFVEQLVQFLSEKLNKEIVATMTYEDEFRNFIGKDVWDSYTDEDDKEWYVSHSENYIESDALNALVEKRFNVDIQSDDFEWFEPMKDVKGNEMSPQEYLDDVVYNFFDTGDLYYDAI